MFVDQPVDFIAELLAAGVIEYAQLHGSEDAAYIEALRKRTALLGKTARIIKTVKVGSTADLENISEIDCEYLLLERGLRKAKQRAAMDARLTGR